MKTRLKHAIALAVVVSLSLFCLGRLTLGVWLSVWSADSMLFLVCCATVPLAGWSQETFSVRQSSLLGGVVGAVIGVSYGLFTGAVVRGGFFIGCLGIGVGWVLARLGLVEIPNSLTRKAATLIASAIAVLIIPLHILEIIYPTQIARVPRRDSIAVGKALTDTGGLNQTLAALVGEPRVEREHWRNDTLKSEIRYVGTVAHGPSSFWYSNGAKRMEAVYDQNTIVSGTYWSRSGNVILECSLLKGWAADISPRDWMRKGPHKLGLAVGPDGEQLALHEETGNLSGGGTITRKGMAYEDVDFGVCYHGLLEWTTTTDGSVRGWDPEKLKVDHLAGTGRVMCIGGRRHGVQEAYYPGGVKRVLMHYANNTPHGACKVWRDDGTLFWECDWVGGQLDGTRKVWHRNGQCNVEEAFVKGVRHGPCLQWHPNGTKSHEFMCANGLREGDFTKWHDNGVVAVRSTLRQGKVEGSEKVWDRAGNLLYEEEYINGVLQCPEKNASQSYKEAWVSMYQVGKSTSIEIQEVLDSARTAEKEEERERLVRIATMRVSLVMDTLEKFREPRDRHIKQMQRARQHGVDPGLEGEQDLAVLNGNLDGYTRGVRQWLK